MGLSIVGHVCYIQETVDGHPILEFGDHDSDPTGSIEEASAKSINRIPRPSTSSYALRGYAVRRVRRLG